MSTERFKEAPWFDSSGKTEVIIGGAGGIGRFIWKIGRAHV